MMHFPRSFVPIDKKKDVHCLGLFTFLAKVVSSREQKTPHMWYMMTCVRGK